jgi:putative membrane protein
VPGFFKSNKVEREEMKLLNYFKSVGFFVMSIAFIGCGGQAMKASQNPDDNLTDANIAAIVVGANKIDISAGKIALDRSTDPKVREFAQRMVTDHQAVLDSAVELVTRLGVTPQNNELVYALSKQSAEHEAKLKNLTGKEFDRLYIDHEVAYHEAVIGVVKTQLIPGAHNQELKDVLTSVLPAFDAHLAHSKNVQASL